MNAADHIAHWLARKEITHAFGIIGAGNVVLWEAITRLDATRLVSVHHEQAAAMAASYFNRAAGRLGACVLLTTGGGAANSTTGVLAAHMDSIPLLVLSGNEPSQYLEKAMRVQGVQGFLTAQVAAPITKWARQARNARSIPLLLDVAHSIALGSRPGPTWLDLPRDVQSQEVA